MSVNLTYPYYLHQLETICVKKSEEQGLKNEYFF